MLDKEPEQKITFYLRKFWDLSAKDQQKEKTPQFCCVCNSITAFKCYKTGKPLCIKCKV